ncbi:hypothetical protein [Neolewinella aurantiaca]|nr:hypothetical protein [Neolewinella aurantiaca]
MRNIWLFCLLICAVLCFDACTKDALAEPVAVTCEDDTPTYEDDIREIVERTCAYSGCHLGGAPGIYDSYDGLLNHLENGRFRQRVISSRSDPTLGMPPDYSPDGRATSLTPDELLIITCWLDAGFPE